MSTLGSPYVVENEREGLATYPLATNSWNRVHQGTQQNTRYATDVDDNEISVGLRGRDVNCTVFLK